MTAYCSAKLRSKKTASEEPTVKGFCLEVSGPYACFTRPEMKVERVSYDVITPSAARAIFDAILWKPLIRWQVKKIEVIAPIRWISVRRNEIGRVASPRSEGIIIEEDRQQRAGLFLRDVKYRLYAEFDIIARDKRGATDNLAGAGVSAYCTDKSTAELEAKYAAMFHRRATKGQCFHQPYLGCREFSAAFQLIDIHVEQFLPIAETRDFGWMFYDFDYSNLTDVKPQFFRATMRNGVIVTDSKVIEIRR